MSTLGRTRLRLAGDTARFDAPLEAARRATPQFWRGTDLQFEIGVFHNGTLQSVANLASMTLELRPLGAAGIAPDPSAATVMARTVTALDDTVAPATWDDGTKQHALLPFTNAETNLAPGLYWLSLWVLTTDAPARLITLAAGPVRVLEDGAGPTSAPPSVPDAYYTAAQSDASFARRSENLNDLASKPAARTNLGLGTAALLNAPATGDAASGEAVKGSDSRLTNSRAPTAHTHAQSEVTNLVTDLAAKAPLASPAFTGTPTAPTPAADDNSTKLATTAHVQGQKGTATPAMNGTGAAGTSPKWSAQDHVHPTDTTRAPTASPTFTGTVTIPTPALSSQAAIAASTDFVMQAAFSPMIFPISMDGMESEVAGSGTTIYEGNEGGGTEVNGAAATALMRKALRYLNTNASYAVIDWSKRIELSFYLSGTFNTSDDLGVGRVTLGKAQGDDMGDLSRKGIGVRITDNVLEGIVHNGTSQTVVSLGGFTVPNYNGGNVHVRIASDGAGNVSWFLNHSLTAAGTTAAGPTGFGGVGDNYLQIETYGGAVGGVQTTSVGRIKGKILR